MAVLPKEDFVLLTKVQSALAQVIRGVGGLRHEVIYIRHIIFTYIIFTYIIFTLTHISLRVSGLRTWLTGTKSLRVPAHGASRRAEKCACPESEEFVLWV